jgi:hypothetical protein
VDEVFAGRPVEESFGGAECGEGFFPAGGVPHFAHGGA